MSQVSRRRLRRGADERVEVDLLISDEEQDSQPLTAHMKREGQSPPPPLSPSPASNTAPRTRARQPSTSASSSLPPFSRSSSAQPMEEKGEVEDGMDEEEKEPIPSSSTVPYSSHFNGVSYHQLSSTLTSLQSSAHSLHKAITASSSLIDAILPTLPSTLSQPLSSLYDQHFLLLNRIALEQVYALDKAKDLVVQGDVGWTTDWEEVVRKGWQEGAVKRRENEDQERAELERRKAARERRAEEEKEEEEEGEGEMEEEEDEKTVATQSSGRMKRERKR